MNNKSTIKYASCAKCVNAMLSLICLSGKSKTLRYHGHLQGVALKNDDQKYDYCSPDIWSVSAL